MLANRKTMDAAAVEWATTLRDMRLKETLQRAKEYSKDPRKKLRLEAQECVVCFYGVHISGQAFTDRQCSDCEAIIKSPNTRVALFCKPCGLKRNLCVMCGAKL
jgi:hypothetical protein